MQTVFPKVIIACCEDIYGRRPQTASSLSFARESIWAAKSRQLRGRELWRREYERPRNSRDFATQLLSLTDFRAKQSNSTAILPIEKPRDIASIASVLKRVQR